MATTLPQLNIVDFEPQIIWLIIIFSLFYTFIRVKIVPYFSDETKSRAQKISDSYHEARKLQIKAERLAEEYNEKIQAVHFRANDLVSEAKSKVKRQVELEKNRLNDEVNIKINDYYKSLESDIASVETQLMNNIDEFIGNARNKIFDSIEFSASKKQVIN